MASILALLGSESARARLSRAVRVERASGARHSLEFVNTAGSLSRRARRSPGCLLVLDPFYEQQLQLPLISWCVRHSPSRGLLLYGDFSGRSADDIFALSRLGVRWAATFGVDDDPLNLRRLILRSANDLPSRRFLSQVRSFIGPVHFRAVEYAFYACLGPTRVGDIAGHLNCSNRQLNRHFASVDLPPPGTLIRWFRAMHAVRLFEDDDRSLNQVASMLGFSNPANLCRLVRDVTGATPSAVRSRGGVVAMQAAFLARLSKVSLRARRPDRADYA